ncbi:MAG TPA: hypothetical protein VHW96_14995 [Solirubrobacteraceae bacterium]|jgi:hypothetical protein|nr:hypothetical protein [Solirubrobacteraceae bacterium]
MSLAALREALLDHGGTLADALGPHGPGPSEHTTRADAGAADPDAGAGAPQLAARGPRASGSESDYELLLEMILEGSLLHYGTPRLVRGADPDLALLLGDQLYALGLARLAELGDLDAVAELADLISLLAQARAASDPELADAVWQAGAAAIGWGTTTQHTAAKALARAGDDRAAQALTGARDAAVSSAGGRPS